MNANGRTGVALFGATGYSGREAARLLKGHPFFDLAAAFGGPGREGVALSSIHPSLRGLVDIPCRSLGANGASGTDGRSPDDADGVADHALSAAIARLRDEGTALALLATPETTSLRLAGPLVRSGFRVVDLSGAFRLRPASCYPEWYGFEHPDAGLLESAVYGLAEWGASDVARASLVANPGCYPTAALMALLPLRGADLIDASAPVVINAVSAASGAGRRLSEELLFCEVEGSIRPYGLPRHRHLPEIATGAGLLPGAEVLFVPHLAPIDRGLLATLSVRLHRGTAPADVAAAFVSAYSSAPFVRLLGEGALPSTGDVRATNTCAIGWTTDATHGRATICAALDNLVKGAAGQALQNLNLMAGRPESEGLPR